MNYKKIKSKEKSSYYSSMKEIDASNQTNPHPGKINNDRIILNLSEFYNNGDINNQENYVLKRNSEDEFVKVNKTIWDYFLTKYGGGPEIIKKSVEYKSNFNNKIVIDLFHKKVLFF